MNSSHATPTNVSKITASILPTYLKAVFERDSLTNVATNHSERHGGR